MDEIQAWFTGALPDGWFTGPPEVGTDRFEILVIGALSDVDLGTDASDEARSEARRARIGRFREETRGRRIEIAQEAERRFRRKVSWGAECGDETKVFTSLGVPVMTRLRMSERSVLDTLIEAGVARNRSHALAWCVRLVSDNQKDWISNLEDALAAVQSVRAEGPKAS